MKQMSKSYLERMAGRNRRNKKIYWTSSFMALPSMSQSHIKRDIICDDEMFEIQYVVIKGKNVLDAILQCPPSTDNQHLRCQSQLRSPEISFCLGLDNTSESCKQMHCIDFGEAVNYFFADLVRKGVGGCPPIFKSPFGKTKSAKGGWDRVRTSYNCFV